MLKPQAIFRVTPRRESWFRTTRPLVNLATIIGIENVSSSGSGVVANANYIFVHIVIFNTGSKEQFDLTLCLSPYDFGFVILQEDPASGLQLVGLGPKRVSKKPSDGPSGGP